MPIHFTINEIRNGTGSTASPVGDGSSRGGGGKIVSIEQFKQHLRERTSDGSR